MRFDLERKLFSSKLKAHPNPLYIYMCPRLIHIRHVHQILNVGRVNLLAVCLVSSTMFAPTVLAQFGPARIIESLGLDGPSTVFAGDLDGDEDIDVLAASFWDREIVWYENSDSGSNFGQKRVISTFGDGLQAVLAADLDGDSDPDVLAASWHSGIVAWFENTDGRGSFAAGQSAPAISPRLWSLDAADLDGDTDLDVLTASYDDLVAWYENVDGQGQLGPQKLLTTDADDAPSVHAADLDGDNDLDVLAALNNQIVWYENTNGQGVFGAEQPISNAEARSVFAADLDNDTDLDVLAAVGRRGIIWFENIDGQGSFGPGYIVATEVSYSVYAADFDNDADLDVLAVGDQVTWYENDGQGTLGSGYTLTSSDGIYTVYPADLDGDTYLDVLVASEGDDQIVWYENLITRVATEPPPELYPSLHLSKPYPNPATNQAYFTLTLSQPQAVQVLLHDGLGRQVTIIFEGLLTTDDPHRFTVEIGGLSPGVYYVQVLGSNMTMTQSLVLTR